MHNLATLNQIANALIAGEAVGDIVHRLQIPEPVVRDVLENHLVMKPGQAGELQGGKRNTGAIQPPWVIDEIAKRRQAGQSLRTIGREMGINRGSLSTIMRKHGIIAPMYKMPFSPQEVQYLVDHQREPDAAIAQALGRGESTIRGYRSRLVRAGHIRTKERLGIASPKKGMML